jgi:hypothetical protein
MELTVEQKIEDVLNKHQEDIKNYYHGDIGDKISHLLSHYKDIAAKEIGNRKSLIEDVLVYFRSVVMISESIGIAGTHAEKAARLRGLIELLNSAINKLRTSQEEHLLSNFSWYSWDYSDYPYRSLIEKLSELKTQNEYFKSQLPEDKKSSLPF